MIKGLIARADNRGLGIQTWEFYRHMHPEKTLVVMMNGLTPYTEYLERYNSSEVQVATYNGGNIAEGVIDWFIKGTDVFYTAETPYDYKIFAEAKRHKVRSILHFNYEFLKYLETPKLPEPSLFIAPSPWNLHNLPFYVPYVPVPVDRERLPFRLRKEAKTFLHIGGHPAMSDRNGTRLLLDAIPFIKSDIRIIIRSQKPRPISHAKNVDIQVVNGDIENYWDLYNDADVLIQPRRYGGLSLPIQEAQSCGMPVISLDVLPQKSFLPHEGLVSGWLMRHIRAQCGMVEVYTCDPRNLAKKIDDFATSPDLVERLSHEADTYASTISWAHLRHRYERLMSV